jgi:tetratricopeptide (TPR) repeat protein
LIGITRTVQGEIALRRGEPATAIALAESVDQLAEPHGALEPARVGPRALIGSARLAIGDVDGALATLRPLAEAADAPSLLFPRQEAVARYAEALLAAGKVTEAVQWARRAIEVPAEQVRSQALTHRVLAEALAAIGAEEEARAAAAEAVRWANATERVSERAPVEQTRSLLEGAA